MNELKDKVTTTGRPGSSNQIADLVLFLASESASHITGP